MTRLEQLERNAKRARTVHNREQARGASDISIRQTRRMYFASMSLMRATGALQRERISQQILGERYVAD